MADQMPETVPPDDSSRLANRNQELEQIVDQIDESVIKEREEQGVPGNVKDREREAGTKGSAHEPTG